MAVAPESGIAVREDTSDMYEEKNIMKGKSTKGRKKNSDGDVCDITWNIVILDAV